MRWVRSEQALHGRVNAALLDKLTVFGKLPDHIEKERQRLKLAAQRVADARNEEEPKPLVDYPVKASLFKHQIRGANMALLTFGFDPEKGGFDE